MLSPHIRPALLVLAILLGVLVQSIQTGAHPQDTADYTANMHGLHISL